MGEEYGYFSEIVELIDALQVQIKWRRYWCNNMYTGTKQERAQGVTDCEKVSYFKAHSLLQKDLDWRLPVNIKEHLFHEPDDEA